MKIEFIAKNDEERMTSINVASALIEHKTEYDNFILQRKTLGVTFEVEDLEEIADHLLAYCRAERKRGGIEE